LVEVLKTQGLGALMGAADDVFDLPLVVCQERVHVILVEQASPLRLGEDEIRQEAETNPAIEWEPEGYS
jgi:hypothetical protein